ncbi:MAG: hydroxyacid dehydrogenase [Ruminococcaceae bacterium]|nr:hydroxyacid dehydrogenase [Oscillospiraceae bacterium]
MKIVVLDRLTLGEDLDISGASSLGEVTVYDSTEPEEIEERISDADIVFVNKSKLNKSNLKNAKKLKLICEAATGFDNIDVEFCKSRNIGVCNVPGYSVYSVAQVTLGAALYLANHTCEYTEYTRDGVYTEGTGANILKPVYNELYGKTWGIIGYGGIGSKVGDAARALGCNVLAYKRNNIDTVECVDLDTLLKKSDIISIHIPLSQETKGLISREKIALMKKTAIVVNTARGAVIDEEAMCEAVEKGKISGFGSDVYSREPFTKECPYYRIRKLKNVCLTPHMAWGAKEARERCFRIMIENAKAFFNGEIKNRVDL